MTCGKRWAGVGSSSTTRTTRMGATGCASTAPFAYTAGSTSRLAGRPREIPRVSSSGSSSSGSATKTLPGQTEITDSVFQHMGPISDAVAEHDVLCFQSQAAAAESAAAGVLPAPIMLLAPSLLHRQPQYQSPLAPAAAKRPPQRPRTTKCCCKTSLDLDHGLWAQVVGLLILGGVLCSFTSAAGIMTTAVDSATGSATSVAETPAHGVTMRSQRRGKALT